MKMIQKSLRALAIFATTTLNVLAASNIDVKVGGRIDPGSCTPDLAGGGSFDYGTIDASTLDETGYTMLREKQVDFTITCTTASKVAVKVRNGRANSVAGRGNDGAGGFVLTPAGVVLFGSTTVSVAGLGTSNGVRVGGYGVRIVTTGVIADGVAVTPIHTDDIDVSAPVWRVTASTTGTLLNATSVRGVSWATAGTRTPVSFGTLSGTLGVQAYLNRKSVFNQRGTLLLDGLSTLELVYLP
jgi:hypothetical protein